MAQPETDRKEDSVYHTQIIASTGTPSRPEHPLRGEYQSTFLR